MSELPDDQHHEAEPSQSPSPSEKGQLVLRELFEDEDFCESFAKEIVFGEEKTYYLNSLFTQTESFRELVEQLKPGEVIPIKWGGDELVFVYRVELADGSGLRTLFIDIGNMGPSQKCFGRVVKVDRERTIVDLFLMMVESFAQEHLGRRGGDHESFCVSVKRMGQMLQELGKPSAPTLEELKTIGFDENITQETFSESLQSAKNLSNRRQLVRDLQKMFYADAEEHGFDPSLEAYRNFLRSLLPQVEKTSYHFILTQYLRLLEVYKGDQPDPHLNHNELSVIQKLKNVAEMMAWFGKQFDDVMDWDFPLGHPESTAFRELVAEKRTEQLLSQCVMLQECIYLATRDNKALEIPGRDPYLPQQAVLLDAQGAVTETNWLGENAGDTYARLRAVLEGECEEALHEAKEDKTGSGLVVVEERHRHEASSARKTDEIRKELEQASHALKERIEGGIEDIRYFLSEIEPSEVETEEQRTFLADMNAFFEDDMRVYQAAELAQHLPRFQKGIDRINIAELDTTKNAIKMILELVRYENPRAKGLKTENFLKGQPIVEFPSLEAFFKKLNKMPQIIKLVTLEQVNTGSINSSPDGYSRVDRISSELREVVEKIVGEEKKDFMELTKDGGGTYRIISYDDVLDEMDIEKIIAAMNAVTDQAMQETSAIRNRIIIDGLGRSGLKDYYPTVPYEELLLKTGHFYCSESFDVLVKADDIEQTFYGLLEQAKQERVQRHRKN